MEFLNNLVKKYTSTSLILRIVIGLVVGAVLGAGSWEACSSARCALLRLSWSLC